MNDFEKLDQLTKTGNPKAIRSCYGPNIIGLEMKEDYGVITIGVDRESIVDLLNDKCMIALYVIDKEEFKKLE